MLRLRISEVVPPFPTYLLHKCQCPTALQQDGKQKLSKTENDLKARWKMIKVVSPFSSIMMAVTAPFTRHYSLKHLKISCMMSSAGTNIC
jgi:hypothetical protein